jgi:CheY-like chemotaxis protein
MRLQCEHCHRGFDLPEDKVPQGTKFRFTCPACKETNHIDLTEIQEQKAQTQQEDRNVMDVPPVQVPPGTQLALIVLANQEVREGVQAYFQARKWQVIDARDAAAGRAYLQKNRIDWAVLGDDAAGREVLDAVHRLPGRERRAINCVLLGENAASFDSLAAFVAGVNSYIHPDHPSKLETSLEQARELFDRHQLLWQSGESR